MEPTFDKSHADIALAGLANCCAIQQGPDEKLFLTCETFSHSGVTLRRFFSSDGGRTALERCDLYRLLSPWFNVESEALLSSEPDPLIPQKPRETIQLLCRRKLEAEPAR